MMICQREAAHETGIWIGGVSFKQFTKSEISIRKGSEVETTVVGPAVVGDHHLC